MRIFFVIMILMNAALACAQPKSSSRSVVFKVRAPASACTIFIEDSVFWVEKECKVRVKVDVKVVFTNGKILSQEEDNYTVRFDSVGSTVVSAYELDGKKRKLIHTQLFKVREPEIYFCGVKVSTRANALKMREEHFKAYSIPLDTMLRVVSFDMQFHNGIKYKTFHSDTSMLTSEMKKVIFEDFRFPADGNKQLFFSNIHARMPDGKLKVLTPITVMVERDSSNREEVVFIFSIRRIQTAGF